MSEVVLDASAVLALLHDEPGGDEVVPRLRSAAISAVNLSEVLTKLVDAGLPIDAATDAVTGLGIDVVPMDRVQALEAAALRPATRSAGLSLGDRACLALARVRRCEAWTTDRAWSGLSLPVRVHQVGADTRGGR